MLALSESSAREALSLLRDLCFYAAILGCLDVPRSFAGDLGPLSESQQKFINELEVVNRKLMDRDSEVIDLQKKVIELFEELRHSKATA